jgi:hypothetical protein
VRITGSVRIDRIPLSPHGGGPIRVHAPLIAPEPALPVHTANSQHPVYRVLPWRVTLVAFLRRIARPFALEALPFTPALRPTEQCFLLVSHDRPPKTRVGRLYAPRWRFARHLVTFVSLPKLPHIAAPSCAPTRVATRLLRLPLRARWHVNPLPGSVVHMLGVAHVPSRLTGGCSVALSALDPLRLSRSTPLTETLLEVGHFGSP